MKERPLLLTSDEARSVLDGSMTQLRLVVETQPSAPYSQTGDHLRAKEPFWEAPLPDGDTARYYAADIFDVDIPGMKAQGFRLKPANRMPLSMSRITLEVTDVRVERMEPDDTSPWVWVIQFKRIKPVR